MAKENKEILRKDEEARDEYNTAKADTFKREIQAELGDVNDNLLNTGIAFRYQPQNDTAEEKKRAERAVCKDAAEVLVKKAIEVYMKTRPTVDVSVLRQAQNANNNGPGQVVNNPNPVMS